MPLPPDFRSDAIPRHIAIFMDGNGRRAKTQGWQRMNGHWAWADEVTRPVEACNGAGAGAIVGGYTIPGLECLWRP